MILVEEFNWDSFRFKDLINICESDIPMIPRKNKIAIKVVSKFNILTSNRSFDDIYNFFDTENIQTYEYRGREKKSIVQRKAIFRRFDKTEEYVHSFIIFLTRNYCEDYRVK